MNINVVVLIAYLAAVYVVCGIPFGKIIAKVNGVDIQSVGSGNIGTTNVAREVGKGAAALTLLFDAGKGILATWLAAHFFPQIVTNGAGVGVNDELGWLVGLVMLAAICGHIFSPFLHFHGGKGIAVGVGSLLGFAPVVGIIELGIFLIIAGATGLVSVGSITVAGIVGFVMAIRYGVNLPLDVVVEIAGLIVVWAHRSNIKKLLSGKESKFSFKKSGEKPAGAHMAEVEEPKHFGAEEDEAEKEPLSKEAQRLAEQEARYFPKFDDEDGE